MKSFNDVLLVEQKDEIVTLTINRPEKKNALNLAVFKALSQAVEQIEKSRDISAVIIRGAGTEAFSSGLDLEDPKVRELFMDSSGEISKESVRNGILTLRKPLDALWKLEIPVIAAVNGYCIGGGFEIALCADIRVATRTASFSLPEVALGFIPDLGGTQRLQAVASTSDARYIIFTTRRISARDAYLMRIVNELVDGDDSYPRALELAREISSQPAYSVRLAKKAIHYGTLHGPEKGLSNELDCAVEAVLQHPFLGKNSKS